MLPSITRIMRGENFKIFLMCSAEVKNKYSKSAASWADISSFYHRFRVQDCSHVKNSFFVLYMLLLLVGIFVMRMPKE